jgi:uncharacterized protein
MAPVRMELARILIRELNDYQIIELREVVDDPDSGDVAPDAEREALSRTPGLPGGLVRSFPIVIGLMEAQAIERRLKGVQVKRPQTHELLSSVIESLGGQLKSISITDLSDHTFFATLDVKRASGEVVRIDARPSDAIALGVANDVPIYVEEKVLDAVMREDD